MVSLINPANQIRVAYTTNQLYLDTASKTALKYYFVSTTGFESSFNNIQVLNKFTVNYYQVLSADPTKVESAEALFRVHEATVDLVPDTTMGTPGSFYAATRVLDPNTNIASFAFDPTLQTPPIATGAIDNYGYDVAVNACFAWGFTTADHAGGPVPTGQPNVYTTQADAALGCLSALFTANTII